MSCSRSDGAGERRRRGTRSAVGSGTEYVIEGLLGHRAASLSSLDGRAVAVVARHGRWMDGVGSGRYLEFCLILSKSIADGRLQLVDERFLSRPQSCSHQLRDN